MKKYRLLTTFALFSSFAFIVTGLILSFVISFHIRDDKLDNFQESLRMTVNIIARYSLTKADLDHGIPSVKDAQIRSDIIDLLDKYNIVSITLINKNRTVIISTDQTLVGKPMLPDKNIDLILYADSSYVISDTSGLLARKQDITVYEPVIYDGIVEGVLALRISDGIISVHMNMIIRAVAWTLSGGLLLLFISLIGILYKTSSTLVKQNEALVVHKAEIEKAYAMLDDSYRNTIHALSRAVDVRDPYTAGHSDRVTKISLLLASQLEMSSENLKTLKCAALFHDIGKLGIPEAILLKNGKLSADEYESVKKHPDIGVSILKNVVFLQDALPIIRHHHERYSGGGYPDGIAKEMIPLGARFIAIADTYDAMTSDRPYRKRLSHDDAVQEILKNKGIQFDDRLVEVFMKSENEIRNI